MLCRVCAWACLHMHVCACVLCILLIVFLFLVFSNRESASCTHVSAVLHALASVNPTSLNLKPNIHSAGVTGDEVPVTSLPCLWKAPRKRKQSSLPLSEAVFQKHHYTRPVKRGITPLEDFDLRPPEFQGTASSCLPALLQKVKGEQLCVSLLLDSSFCHGENLTIPTHTSSPNLPDMLPCWI